MDSGEIGLEVTHAENCGLTCAPEMRVRSPSLVLLSLEGKRYDVPIRRFQLMDQLLNHPTKRCNNCFYNL